MASSPYRILFVCLGNICRSPAGENTMNHLIELAGLTDHIISDSAGTAGWHTGKGPDPRMTKTLESRGITVTGRAQQLTSELLASHDLILTMDDDNYHEALKVDSQNLYREKIKRFTSFCENSTLTEVPDPYYGGDDGFETVADLMQDGCTHILAQIKKERSL